MKKNLHLSETRHIEKVARGNLVTLLSVTNGRSDQSVNQWIDRRTEGALLGRLGNINSPSVTPDRHVVVLLWWFSNIAVEISIKMRSQSLLNSRNQ